MAAPKDLPGFYYDAEKNRYFPVKGPIPGSKRTASAALATCSSSKKESKIEVIRKDKRIKVSHLLGLRETHGRNILFSSRRYDFHKQYEEIKASQPTVWKFQGANNVDTAIERVPIQLHTQTGTKDALFLAARRSNGSLSFFQVDNPEGHHFIAESVWPPLSQNEASCFSNYTIPSLSFSRNLSFPSEVSCVKLCGGSSDHLLVTTLGSGAYNGSLYYLDTNIMSDFLTTGSDGYECIFAMDGTVWTADCNFAGTHAALGTSKGSVLFDLEVRSPVQIYRSKSDVLSQQFISSGNVLLRGLRNGSILMVDTREKQIGDNTEAIDRSSATLNPRMMNLHLSRRERRNVIQTRVDGGLGSLGHARMSSAVCSMASLSTDENYFLASSMDGLIKLFDIRALRNESVQSYKGHVNSHSRLQLAVNPSETLVLSGGEDCRVRIWNIKTGELIFSEIFSESCCTTALWSGLQVDENCQRPGGAWLGSRDGLFYMQCA